MKFFMNEKATENPANSETTEESSNKAEEAENENFEEDYAEDNFEEDETETEKTPFIHSAYLKTLYFVMFLGAVYAYFDRVVYKDMETKVYKFWFEKYFSFIYKPNIKEFLPMDPPLHPSIKQKTLIISFENMLYHKNYEAGSGIVIDLRPGLRDFLKDLARKYEIVLFSDEDSQFMDEVISTVDPYNQYFKYAFGREFFTLTRGRYMKDYTYFNRDFANVVIVDFGEKQTLNKNENLVVIGPYNGENSDNSLNELKSFLLHCHKYDDTRKVISNFGGKDCVKNFTDQKKKYTDKLKKKKGYIESFFGKK